MSIGASAVGEAAIGAQGADGTSTTKRPPRIRVIVAKADTVAQPEAR